VTKLPALLACLDQINQQMTNRTNVQTGDLSLGNLCTQLRVFVWSGSGDQGGGAGINPQLGQQPSTFIPFRRCINKHKVCSWASIKTLACQKFDEKVHNRIEHYRTKRQYGEKFFSPTLVKVMPAQGIPNNFANAY